MGNTARDAAGQARECSQRSTERGWFAGFSPQAGDQPQDDHLRRVPDDGVEQQALIAERDAPLIGAFVVDRVGVDGRALEELAQALVDELTEVGR